MLTGLAHLALEVKSMERARAFYVDRLGLTPSADSDTDRTDDADNGDECRFHVGETELILRRPRRIPRGGLHTHYAFTTGADAYDGWVERLADLDPDEHAFGSYRSLYVDDPDDHCVEIGSLDSDAEERGLADIFELVLEVESLERAERLYTALGFEVADRGETRRRVRLRGPFDLELWEPQLGLAAARGGVHVDFGLETDDPEAAVEAIESMVSDVTRLEDGIRVRDPDCHYVTFASRE
ncbi:VOC family protein [Haloferacaceae archaeon DSL9]